MQELAQLVPIDEEETLAKYLNKEGLVFFDAGKYSEAKAPLERALAIWEKVLGPEHPNVATSLDNLALLYDVQGRYEKAEPLYLRSLAIREKVLGAEHSHVAASLNNLAALYNAQGRYEEAKPLNQRSKSVVCLLLPSYSALVVDGIDMLISHGLGTGIRNGVFGWWNNDVCIGLLLKNLSIDGITVVSAIRHEGIKSINLIEQYTQCAGITD